MYYDLAASTWAEEEVEALNGVIASTMFTMGANVRRFEEAFADKFGKKHAIMVNSGSSANLVATAALAYKRHRPLQRGDEIIVPAISWSTTFYPFQQYGLKLRFLDVELDTLNMDVAQLEAALTPKTRAVAVVSILGNPAALNTVRAFCDKHDLIMFEDNCESMGATLNGKPAGTFGDVGTFSFFFSHHISTMEGGMILTNDDELFELCRAMRNHGWTRDQPAGSSLFSAREDDFFEAYRFVVPGYNVRPLELSGAVGLVQLNKVDQFTATRRANAQHFKTRFGTDPRFITQRENGESSWFSFTIILNPELKLDRKRVMQSLKTADIGYRIITGGNFLRHDVIKYFDYDCVGTIVNANIAHDHGFFVGNHPFDLRDRIDTLYQVLDAATR